MYTALPVVLVHLYIAFRSGVHVFEIALPLPKFAPVGWVKRRTLVKNCVLRSARHMRCYAPGNSAFAAESVPSGMFGRVLFAVANIFCKFGIRHQFHSTQVLSGGAVDNVLQLAAFQVQTPIVLISLLSPDHFVGTRRMTTSPLRLGENCAASEDDFASTAQIVVAHAGTQLP